MKRAVVWALVLSAAACSSSDSVVVVNVTAEGAALPVTRLRLSLSSGAVKDTKLFPDAGDASTMVLVWPATLALVLPRARTGSLDLAVDGLDAGGVVVAAGSAQTIIVVGGRTTVSVTLARSSGACGDGKMGPTEECDDGNRFSGDGCSFVCLRESTGGGADAPAGNPIDGRGSDLIAGGGGGTSGGGGSGGSPAMMSAGGAGGAPVGVSGLGGMQVIAPGGTDAATTPDSAPLSLDAAGSATGPDGGASGATCTSAKDCKSALCLSGKCAPDSICLFTVADAGTCQNQTCGGPGQPCCGGRICKDDTCCVTQGQVRTCIGPGASCGAVAGTCQMNGSCGAGCGGLGQPCCGASCTASGATCGLQQICVHCGALGEPCCSPGTPWSCQSGAVCDTSTAKCSAASTALAGIDLAAYWRLDEGQGTSIVDSTRVNPDGSLVNGPIWSLGGPPQLKFANPYSLAFDGVDDFALIASGALPALEAPKTVTLWVKPTPDATTNSVSQNFIVIKDPQPPTYAAIQLGIRQGAISMWGLWGRAGIGMLSAPAMPIGSVWIHVAYSFDGLVHRLFVNGVEVAMSRTVGATGTADRVRLGAVYFDGKFDERFKGYLDEVRIYRRALDPAEIRALADGQP